jgi:bla regulator protein BlaR1
MRHPVILAALALLLGTAAAARAEDWHDNVDLAFVDDPAVLGQWVSVDFVATPDQFVPGAQRFQDAMYLSSMEFQPGGAMSWATDGEASTPRPWIVWTKGLVLHQGGDKTASGYTIKRIDGETYMFLEWKSGDYIIRHQKPRYYVLKKK